MVGMESVVGIGIKLIRYSSMADGTGDGEIWAVVLEAICTVIGSE